MPPAGQLYEWFHSPNTLHAIAGHNIHDDFGQQQYGGTFLLGNGEITSSISSTGSNPLDWDAGSGLPSLARQESLHTLSALTAPATPPHSNQQHLGIAPLLPPKPG